MSLPLPPRRYNLSIGRAEGCSSNSVRLPGRAIQRRVMLWPFLGVHRLVDETLPAAQGGRTSVVRAHPTFPFARQSRIHEDAPTLAGGAGGPDGTSFLWCAASGVVHSSSYPDRPIRRRVGGGTTLQDDGRVPTERLLGKSRRGRAERLGDTLLPRPTVLEREAARWIRRNIPAVSRESLRSAADLGAATSSATLPNSGLLPVSSTDAM